LPASCCVTDTSIHSKHQLPTSLSSYRSVIVGLSSSLQLHAEALSNITVKFYVKLECSEFGRTYAVKLLQNKQNSVVFSPRANYTDWATATCRRNLVPTFVDRGVSRGQRRGSPAVVNLSFLDRSRYFQVAPHLLSQGLSGPCSRSTSTQKCGKGRESNPGPLS
jgi:hypothetical protein